MAYDFTPIGRVHSQLSNLNLAPRQGMEGAPNAWIVVEPRFAPGLVGLRRGEHVLVLTWMHRAARRILKVHPRGDRTAPLAGVFATRSPARPNPVGLHAVKVLEISDDRMKVGPIEAIDGAPVIDIKPVLAREA